MEKDRVTLPPSHQEPSQGELVAEEDQDPLVSGWECRLLGMGNVCELRMQGVPWLCQPFLSI